ncbi:hypothetical protein MUP77_22935 [Candidatus Bathyarchaeota archaeon]|nr:hypothetical protein [Candidatus Bathyarchaeota archaeon]
MQDSQRKWNLTILWSHNEEKHPFWLNTIMRTGGSVWWDVRWKLNPNQFDYPLTGYIWNTVEQKVTHKASILEVAPKPSEERMGEVLRSWREARFHVNPNSPLLLYQKDQSATCTLLKLSSLVRLKNPGELEGIILHKENRPIGQGPQGVAIINDPQLI